MAMVDHVRRVAATACLLLAVAGCHRQSGEQADEAASPATGGEKYEQADASSGLPRVAVDAATQQRLGIELAPIGTSELKAVARGTAVVLDGAALVAQLADLEAARADASAAREAYLRLDRLYRDDGNASRSARDAARAQDVAANAHVAALVAHAGLDWGARIVGGTDTAAASLRDGIVQGRVTPARAEFSDPLPADAEHMQYELLDAGGSNAVPVTFVERSHAPVQSTQGTGVLIAIESTAASAITLRPGERRPVIAETATGTTRAIVPAAAAVADGGRLWCYVARGDAAFERVPLDADGQIDAGFPVNAAVAAGDRVVVRGASILLSLERGSSPGSTSGAAPDED